MGTGMVSHGSIRLPLARLRKLDSKLKLKRLKEIFLRERCLRGMYEYSEES